MYHRFISNHVHDHFFTGHLNYYLILFHYFSSTYKLDFQKILLTFKKFMLETSSNDHIIKVSFARAKKLGINDIDYHSSVLYAFFHFHKTSPDLDQEINPEIWHEIAVQIIDWDCKQVVTRALTEKGSEDIKLIHVDKRNEKIVYLNDKQIKINIKQHLDNAKSFLTEYNIKMSNTILNYYNNYLPTFSIEKNEKKEIEKTLNYLYKYSLHTQKRPAV